MEELNQVQDENVFADESIREDENLFDDWAEETTETESEEPTEETTEKAEEAVENPFGLDVVYNGEQKTLNKEEATTYAQKGMNYDKIYTPLERLARMNNMSVSDFLNQLNETQIQFEVSKEVDRMRENPKYEGVSDEVLEEIAHNHVMENVSLQDKNYEEDQRAQADAQQEMIKRDVDKFIKEYPEFKGEGSKDLDPKVFEYVREGYTLLEAYNKFQRENPVNQATAKASKQNEENKKRSLGNTTNVGKVEADDFLSGFLKG